MRSLTDRPLKRSLYNDWYWGYLLIAPTIIGLMILNIWPIIKTLQISFMQDLGFNRFEWIGLENYIDMAHTSNTWKGLYNTLFFSLVSVPAGVFISLIFAALLFSDIRGKGIYRTIFFLPVIVIPAAMAIVWRLIFHSRYGILNIIMMKLGLPAFGWIIDPNIAMFTLISVAIWGNLGTRIIILLAGMTQIPKSLYEAARIDGAGPVNVFFHVTIPMVIPSIFFLTITGFINALREFDTVYLIFMGTNATNPAMDSVRTLMYEFFRYGFVGTNKGYASAIVILAFAVILVFTVLQNILQKKISHFE